MQYHSKYNINIWSNVIIRVWQYLMIAWICTWVQFNKCNSIEHYCVSCRIACKIKSKKEARAHESCSKYTVRKYNQPTRMSNLQSWIELFGSSEWPVWRRCLGPMTTQQQQPQPQQQQQQQQQLQLQQIMTPRMSAIIRSGQQTLADIFMRKTQIWSTTGSQFWQATPTKSLVSQILGRFIHCSSVLIESALALLRSRDKAITTE